jgi:hypothetical protein
MAELNKFISITRLNSRFEATLRVLCLSERVVSCLEMMRKGLELL